MERNRTTEKTIMEKVQGRGVKGVLRARAGVIRARKGGSRGFTLVEVIVVLVILAILAAILIPTYVNYIAEANERVCKLDRSNITRYYQLYLQTYDTDDVGFEEYVMENYGDMDEMCPSGGKYSYTEDKENGEVIVTCSVHGSPEDSAEKSMAAIGKNLLKQTFVNYFAGKDTREINSEAPKADGISGMAVAMNDLLKEQGIDTDNSSWKVELKDGRTYIYWTGTKISNSKVNDEIAVSRCEVNMTDGSISNLVSGTTVVGSQKTGSAEYNVIDSASFKTN
ncbi:MAG: prepilin-type N-terminal cleavage/methylation domain-containing protein [Bacillota bacterium]|nr:prepilin-type N-terminal cleavage/methylation domain-containing protein [Bacillota bacterium]